MSKPKKNLSRKVIRMLRNVEQFLLSEPRRFNMRYGLINADKTGSMLEQPPCGTACCIAGAMYVVSTNAVLKNTSKDWHSIMQDIKKYSGIDTRADIFSKLFFMQSMHGGGPGYHWPEFYENAYMKATTQLERACIGVARIEHFIATDGQE